MIENHKHAGCPSGELPSKTCQLFIEHHVRDEVTGLSNRIDGNRADDLKRTAALELRQNDTEVTMGKVLTQLESLSEEQRKGQIRQTAILSGVIAGCFALLAVLLTYLLQK